MLEAVVAAQRLILLAPIEPSPIGNGLAMRVEVFRRAAACDYDVQTVVVPVAGQLHAGGGSSTAVVAPDRAGARAGATALVGDPVWRDRLARSGVLPDLARAAPPGLFATATRALADGPVAVHVMRAYLAPLGVAVAERLEARWITLDLDEDDATVASASGDVEGAAAYERLLAVFGPLFDGLAVASAAEADVVGTRHGLVVEHLPNAIAAPAKRTTRSDPTGSDPSLLFVGNLTHEPNVEAASILAETVLPRVQQRLGRRVHLRLVGAHDQRLARLAGPDVELAGFVPDLAPVYASADVVVVPLRTGGGTRIKLLEAFAHGVPVVASPAGAAGLDVSDQRHLLLAEGADRTAAAVETVLTDDSVARRLVAEADRLVRDLYTTDAVIPVIRGFFARAAARARERPPGSR